MRSLNRGRSASAGGEPARVQQSISHTHCRDGFSYSHTLCRKAKKTIMQVSTKVRMLIIALLGGIPAMAQSTAGDYSAGTTALSTVAEEIVKYVPVMVKLCYAIAGVVAIIGAISVYIAMNNEEQDVKKKIMMVVGACLFLIAAAQALPLFFGINA
jgi:type IV secretory pathway VirB2 component (pilin)